MKIYRSFLFFSLFFLFGGGALAQENFAFSHKLNDSTTVDVFQMTDESCGLPLYFYSSMVLPVCSTGECRVVRLTMFWDSFGNYLKYEVPKDYPLTKNKHEPFSKKEYVQLHLILNDTSLRYDNLALRAEDTEENARNKYKIDAITGETPKPFYDERRIKGAIKTTWHLWKLANGDIGKNILKRVRVLLKSHDINKASGDFRLAYNIQANIFTDVSSIETYILNDKSHQSLMTANYLLRRGWRSKKAKNTIKNVSFINK